MANPFDQFDEPTKVNAFDRFDQIQIEPTENVDERGVPIEPGKAVKHEFFGGTKQIGRGIRGEGAESIISGRGLEEPATNIVEGALRVVNAPFVGAGRIAGRTLQDLLQPYLGVEPAAGVASVADAAAQLGVPFAATKLSQLLKAATRSAIPLRTEKVTTLRSTLAGEETAAARQAIEEAKQVQLNLAKQREKATIAPRQFQEEISPAAPSAEEAGRKFAKETFPARKAEVKAEFNKAYDDLIESGTGIEASTANTEAALDKVLGETGILRGALSTKAESAASRIKRGLKGEPEGEVDVETAVRSAIGGRRNSLELQEEVYNRVRDKIISSGPGVPQHLSVDLLKEAAIAEEVPKTAADLVQTTLRIRAAKRAAFDSNQPNIGRQFREIEKGLMKDIEQTNLDLASNFADVTSAYGREFAPLFSPKALPERLIKRVREDVEEVVPSIIQPRTSPRRVESINTAFRVITDPKDKEAITGAWLRTGIEKASMGGWKPKEFVKYWDNHLDPKTNNHVLRKAFGEDKFQKINDFVDELRASKPASFDKIADEAITNIVGRKTSRLKDVRAEFEKAVTEIEGKPLTARHLQAYAVWHGTFGLVQAISGSPWGIRNLGIAGLLLISSSGLTKLLNTVRGADLARRALRAGPGTSEAVSVAAQIEALLKAIPQETK